MKTCLQRLAAHCTMLSEVNFMSLKSAHRILLHKKKADDYKLSFPNLDQVLEQVRAKLVAYSAGWDKINYRLTETQQKSKRRLQSIWLTKARISGVQDVSKFFYKL